ncbi:hypothetical protein C1H69_07620 [Billgrantia endophytica]|uniref:Uncharacterized protein n=2 Tax=Billgrantia endophytica TaxID=2033802 RepID=A0A2N7U715_9GAMM|nr:hypothetical protein C1H69_07620 [Halomonas endophytica]
MVSALPRESRAPVPGRARQLLGQDGTAADTDTDTTESSDGAGKAQESRSFQEPLRFSLQMACLDGRWLILVPGANAPDDAQLSLLANLLQAGGVIPQQLPAFQGVRWPPMEGLPVEAPLEEARQGLQAFVEGAGRHGWTPERVLVFGQDETLDRLLGLHEGHCELLDLPGWRGVALDELATSAEAKRALWPTLHEWRDAWESHGASGSPDA